MTWSEYVHSENSDWGVVNKYYDSALSYYVSMIREGVCDTFDIPSYLVHSCYSCYNSDIVGAAGEGCLSLGGRNPAAQNVSRGWHCWEGQNWNRRPEGNPAQKGEPRVPLSQEGVEVLFLRYGGYIRETNCNFFSKEQLINFLQSFLKLEIVNFEPSIFFK